MHASVKVQEELPQSHWWDFPVTVPVAMAVFGADPLSQL